MSRATNDLDAVRDFLGPGIMYFANTTITFVMSVFLMGRIDLRLTLLSLIPLPIVSVVMARLGARLFQNYEAIQASMAALTAKAQETLAGIRVVKAHVEEEGEYQAFSALHDDYTEKNRRMIRIMSSMWPSLSLLGGIATAIVLWVGGSAVVRGQITLGGLVAFQISGPWWPSAGSRTCSSAGRRRWGGSARSWISRPRTTCGATAGRHPQRA